MLNLIQFALLFLFPTNAYAQEADPVGIGEDPLGGQRIEVPGNPLFQPGPPALISQ